MACVVAAPRAKGARAYMPYAVFMAHAAYVYVGICMRSYVGMYGAMGPVVPAGLGLHWFR